MSLSDAVSSFPSWYPLTLGGTPDSEQRPHGAEGGETVPATESCSLTLCHWLTLQTPSLFKGVCTLDSDLWGRP